MNDYIRKRRTAKQILLRRALSKGVRNGRDTETTTPLGPLSKTGITVLSSLAKDPKRVRAMQRTFSRSKSSRERSDRRPKSQSRPKTLKNAQVYPLLKTDSRSWRKIKTSDGIYRTHWMEGKSGVSLGGAPSRGSSRSRYSSSAYPSTWALDVRNREEEAEETSNSLAEVTNCTRLNRTPYDHQLSTPLKSDHSVQCSMRAAARRQRQRRTNQPREMCVAQTQTMPKLFQPKLLKHKPVKKSVKHMFTSMVGEKLLERSRSPSKTSQDSLRIRKTRHRHYSGEEMKHSRESARAKPTARQSTSKTPRKCDPTDYGGYTPSDVSLELATSQNHSITELRRGTGGKLDDSRWIMKLPTERDIEKYIHDAAVEDCMSCSARDRMSYPESYNYDESTARSSSPGSSCSKDCMCAKGGKKRTSCTCESRVTEGSSRRTNQATSKKNSARHTPISRGSSQSSASNEPRSPPRKTRDKRKQESLCSLDRNTGKTQAKSRGHRGSVHASLNTDSQAMSRGPTDYGRASTKSTDSSPCRSKSNAIEKTSKNRDKGNSERRGTHREKPTQYGNSSVEAIPVKTSAENLRKKTSQMISQKNSVHSINSFSRQPRTDACKDPKCKRKCRRCADASTVTSKPLITAAETNKASTDNPNRGATNSCGICPVTKTCDPKCVEAFAQTSQSKIVRQSRSPTSKDFPNRSPDSPQSELTTSPDPQSVGRSTNQSRRGSTTKRTTQQQGPCGCGRPNCGCKYSEACTQTSSRSPKKSSTKVPKKNNSGIGECDMSRIIAILQKALEGLEMEQRARGRGSTSHLVDRDRSSESSDIIDTNVDNCYESAATNWTYTVQNGVRGFDPFQCNMCYYPESMCGGAANITEPSIPFINGESLRPETKQILKYIDKINGKMEADRTPTQTDQKRTKPEKNSFDHGPEIKRVEDYEQFVMGQSKDGRETLYSSSSKSSHTRYGDDHIFPSNSPNPTNFSWKSDFEPHLADKFFKTRAMSKVRDKLVSHCPVFGIKSNKRSNIFLVRRTSGCKYMPIRQEKESNYKLCLHSKGRTAFSLSERELRVNTRFPPDNSISAEKLRDRTRFPPENSKSAEKLRDRTRYPTENSISTGKPRGRTQSPTENSISAKKPRGRTEYPTEISRTTDTDLQPKKRPYTRNTRKSFITMPLLNSYDQQILKDFDKYRTAKAEAAAAAEAAKSICQQEPMCSYLKYQADQKAAASKICQPNPKCPNCRIVVKTVQLTTEQTEQNKSLPDRQQKHPFGKSKGTPGKNPKDRRREKKPSKSRGFFSWCAKKDKEPNEENKNKEQREEKAEKRNREPKERTSKESLSYTKTTKSEAPIQKYKFLNLNSQTFLKKYPASETYEYQRIPEQSQPAKNVVLAMSKTYAGANIMSLKPGVNFCNIERPPDDDRNEVQVLYDSSARFAKDTCSVRILPDPPMPSRPRFGDCFTSSSGLTVPSQCDGGQQQQKEYKNPSKCDSTNAFYSMFQKHIPNLKSRNFDCEFQRKWEIF
ncbi:uncharacterized protein LOC6589717 isoform X1 [Drosophila persimilis]|uniref:uncharacterized protein LOC6589717 isoform X1 n=2 Tax=Drosophila persimilis TaxID=7234 RepID=UPI000F095785|nr:uncharacterized protein LOC6589717 isoform X1 [Drosophila persimilis]